MGRLDRRFEHLEERLGAPEPPEEVRKHRWLERAHYRGRHDLSDWNAGYGKVRDILRLLQGQGRLGRTAEEVLGQLLAWRPPHDPAAFERELAKFIYHEEEGTENMVCPPEWREAFSAADELREKHAAIPVETYAQMLVAAHDLEEEGDLDEVGELLDTELGRWGITAELEMRAIGPDVEGIPAEEHSRRLREILADIYYGEQGYRIQQGIDKLMEERSTTMSRKYTKEQFEVYRREQDEKARRILHPQRREVGF
jgi:hypothetical protein